MPSSPPDPSDRHVAWTDLMRDYPFLTVYIAVLVTAQIVLTTLELTGVIS